MSRREKISITLNPKIKQQIIEYSKIQSNKSVSQNIERAIELYLNQDKLVLSKEIENAIKYSIKTFEDRYCRILAKNCKTTYAEFYLLLNMFAYMSNNEDNSKFLKDMIEEANKQGYMALKDGLIERDIDTLFPKKELDNRINKRLNEK